jgi:hypothetical protein
MVQLHDKKEMELHEDCRPDGNSAVVSSPARFVWKLHQFRLNCSEVKLTKEACRFAVFITRGNRRHTQLKCVR